MDKKISRRGERKCFKKNKTLPEKTKKKMKKLIWNMEKNKRDRTV